MSLVGAVSTKLAELRFELSHAPLQLGRPLRRRRLPPRGLAMKLGEFRRLTRARLRLGDGLLAALSLVAKLGAGGHFDLAVRVEGVAGRHKLGGELGVLVLLRPQRRRRGGLAGRRLPQHRLNLRQMGLLALQRPLGTRQLKAQGLHLASHLLGGRRRLTGRHARRRTCRDARRLSRRLDRGLACWRLGGRRQRMLGRHGCDHIGVGTASGRMLEPMQERIRHVEEVVEGVGAQVVGVRRTGSRQRRCGPIRAAVGSRVESRESLEVLLPRP